jgi:hypothetical protein
VEDFDEHDRHELIQILQWLKLFDPVMMQFVHVIENISQLFDVVEVPIVVIFYPKLQL